MHAARSIVALTFLAALTLTGCASERPRSTVFSLTDARPARELAEAPRESSTGRLRNRADVEAPDAPDDQVVATSFQQGEAQAANAPPECERCKPESPEPEPCKVVETSSSGAGLALATLESWALRCNPAIQQASASAYKAMGFRDQVGLAPNPTIGFFGEQIGDDGTDQYGAFVSQDFVTAGKLVLNRNVLSHSVQSQLWEIEAQRYRVVTDVRLRFYDALAAQQRCTTVSYFETILKDGVCKACKRNEIGESPVQEVYLAELQLKEFQLQKQRAEFAFRGAWNELTAIAGNPNLQPTTLELPGPIFPEHRDWDVVYHDIQSRSPELKAANARVCRAAANVERQQAQPVPNLEVQAGFGHDLATDQQFGRLQAGLPIPLFNKNQGNISAADAEYCRAQQDYRRLQMSLRARLAKASQDFDSARAAVEFYGSQLEGEIDRNLPIGIVRRARDAREGYEKAYAAGGPDFLEVLTARRTYFDASLQLIDARRDLAQAAASIDGLLLSGGLDATVDTPEDDGLRGQALSGQ